MYPKQVPYGGKPQKIYNGNQPAKYQTAQSPNRKNLESQNGVGYINEKLSVINISQGRQNENTQKVSQFQSYKRQHEETQESYQSPNRQVEIAKQVRESCMIQEIRFKMLPQSMPYHPLVDDATMENLQQNFPGAIFSSQAFTQINYTLLSLGFRKENTLFASSVCVDEINHLDCSLNNRLKQFWGECFYMGGLGGIPFIGKVGFGAYSAHVPINGNLFIFFAPHVGVSPNGQIGKYARDNQDHLDNACGAAIGALGKLKSNPPAVGDERIDLKNCDLVDIQFFYIQQALKKHYHHIVRQPNEQAALAYAMYEIVHKFVKDIVKTIPGTKLILVGGIQINMKKPIEDMFMPLCFEILEHNKPIADYSKVFMQENTVKASIKI